jgi:hypothetical protein
VWYVQAHPGDANTTLIVVLAADHPDTRFYRVWTYGGNSPYGNFSISVLVNNEKTWLAFPAASCPVQPDSTYTEQVSIYADSPQGETDFTFTCTQNPGTITLGNPHVIVPQLKHPPPPPPRAVLSLDSSAFSSGTDATLNIRNSGTLSASLVSYYVKDGSGNQWAQTSWAGPSIGPNAVGVADILIGSSCGSCTYTGASGAFTQFNSGNSYTILIVTSDNHQYSFNVVR